MLTALLSRVPGMARPDRHGVAVIIMTVGVD
jgi:hypothetical protein